jgi:hypothetical protein
MRKLKDMDEEELRGLMSLTAKAIETTARELGVEKPLFVLVLFNDPAIGQYISNCDRSTTVAAMRETADRLERREDVTR